MLNQYWSEYIVSPKVNRAAINMKYIPPKMSQMRPEVLEGVTFPLVKESATLKRKIRIANCVKTKIGYEKTALCHVSKGGRNDTGVMA